VVRRLAGILRLAVGLDRSHAQEIHRVRLRCTRRTAFIDVEANGNPSVDLWAGARHCGLFEEACGRRVRFRWAPPERPGAGAEEELIDARS
jgi:exopolyphosphatase/guanosine-5'-triphosphate,3'-diphosphate pyrophosphatase